MNFLSQFFSQPAMLGGALLVGVPILIYLINRRRYQRRQWAAMEFLLRALQKNRRRLQLENLLLLLVRCAIIALLAAAMARPFVRHSALSRLSDQPENWIFAIDTSYSMDWREGTRSAFEIAREAISRIVQEVAKPGDRVAVMTFDAEPRVVYPPRPVTEATRGQVLEALNGLSPGYRSIHLPACLRAVLDLSAEFETAAGGSPVASAKKLILFTDFQAKDWLGENGPRDPAVLDLIRALNDAGIAISRAELRRSDRNLTLAGLEMSPLLVSRDVWVEFTATVRNFGREDFETVEMAFIVDGVEERTHVLRIAAGSTVTRHFPYRFTDAAYHAVTVEIRGDGLGTDNRRHLAVRVREEADVLVVDGEPGDSELDRETLLLELALLPEESDEFRRAPYRPVVRTVEQVLNEAPELEGFVAIVFANVSAADLNERFVDEVRQFVRRGGALVAFAGKNVVPEDYNRLFHKGDGDLLPLPIAEIVERDVEPVHLSFVKSEHPIARFFAERSQYTYLEKPYIEFRRFVRFERPAAGLDLRPLFVFDDAESSLAAFDAPCGSGRVLWVASSADLEWNDFAKYPDFVPFIHEAIPYVVRFGESAINLSLGQPYRESFSAEEFAPQVQILPPRSPDREPLGPPALLPKQLERLGGDNRFTLLHEETSVPGHYEVRLERPGAAPDVENAPSRRRLFAVNVDPDEGDLRIASPDALADQFPALQMDNFDAEERIKEVSRSRSAAGGTELWRAVLWAVFVLLVAESVLAVFFGRSLK
jgi:hypothetical protein